MVVDGVEADAADADFIDFEMDGFETAISGGGKHDNAFNIITTWTVYDSLIRHMDDIHSDIILQLTGASLDPTDEEAIVPFIIEQ